MSWVRIWVHLVFSTKKREPTLQKEIRADVLEHIKKNAKLKDLYVRVVNGYTDHIHCLISLNRDLSISKTAQLIKGESSHWINKNKLTKKKFEWQDDYWAVGVSESHVKSVERYIQNQEEHHRTKTFTEEIDDFMEKYDWQLIKGEKAK